MYLWKLKSMGSRATGMLEMINNEMRRYFPTEALQESEARYRALFEQVADSILLIRAESGRILGFNDTACESLGYTRKEFENLKISDFKAHETDDDVNKRIVKIVKEGFSSFETQHRRKDGGIRTVQANCQRIKLQGKNLIQVIYHDITEQRKIETEILERLAGGIAHDFNNLISPIIGYSELLLANAPPNGNTRNHLEEILKAALGAADLTRQILTFGRRNRPELKPLFIQSSVREALKHLQSSIPGTITFKQHISDQCNAVMGHSTQIHQMIGQLCANACHAMEKTGGILEVSLTEVEFESKGRLYQMEFEPGEYIRLTVSDTGHGMESHVLERIFDPYFSTREPGKGTGLGLAVVHGIVREHGGYIKAYSTPGKGSTFHVYLPVIASDTRSPEKKPSDMILEGTHHIFSEDGKTCRNEYSRLNHRQSPKYE